MQEMPEPALCPAGPGWILRGQWSVQPASLLAPGHFCLWVLLALHLCISGKAELCL